MTWSHDYLTAYRTVPILNFRIVKIDSALDYSLMVLFLKDLDQQCPLSDT